MRKLIQERIIKTEEQPLSASDKTKLIAKRNKQLKYLSISYVPLALIIAYVFFSGPAVVYREQYPYSKHEITEDDISNFNIAAPYFCGFLFLLLTGFFIRYFLQTAAPLIRDIKGNKKLLVYVNPEKTDMGFLNKYYITTPIFKKQQLAVSKEYFYMISNNGPLILELAPHSVEILKITSNEKQILFY
ncbi:hypothetical protein [Terrimonas pollutisoli]|uniref:hypothetical protein n=1 Tax=Terrimonas pollutisoli TaxID=3034147 RepID=UPI0023EC085A|nr:hypothetical protein [Terrimonas sp. H1YJ31]